MVWWWTSDMDVYMLHAKSHELKAAAAAHRQAAGSDGPVMQRAVVPW